MTRQSSPTSRISTTPGVVRPLGGDDDLSDGQRLDAAPAQRGDERRRRRLGERAPAATRGRVDHGAVLGDDAIEETDFGTDLQQIVELPASDHQQATPARPQAPKGAVLSRARSARRTPACRRSRRRARGTASFINNAAQRRRKVLRDEGAASNNHTTRPDVIWRGVFRTAYLASPGKRACSQERARRARGTPHHRFDRVQSDARRAALPDRALREALGAGDITPLLTGAAGPAPAREAVAREYRKGPPRLTPARSWSPPARANRMPCCSSSCATPAMPCWSQNRATRCSTTSRAWKGSGLRAPPGLRR